MNARLFLSCLGLIAAGAMTLVTESSRAEDWRTLVSCEGGKVRLEGYRGSWQHTDFQFVVATELPGTVKLLNEGGINSSNINEKGEWILRNVTPWRGQYTFRAYAPRDAGTLVYKITPSEGKLAVTVGWTSGNPYDSEVTDFTSAEFNGCAKK